MIIIHRQIQKSICTLNSKILKTHKFTICICINPIDSEQLNTRNRSTLREETGNTDDNQMIDKIDYILITKNEKK